MQMGFWLGFALKLMFNRSSYIFNKNDLKEK